MPEYDKTRDPRKLEPYYCRHIAAMTSEDLHEKSDIAKELAARDKRIDALIVDLEANADLLVIAHMQGHHDRDDEVRKLQYRINHLEKILKFYAAEDTYDHRPTFDGTDMYLPIMEDCGTKARCALGEEEEL